MAGLLDFAKSPAGQGLLAAGFAGLAGANRNTPINNIGRAGLAGITGYSAASALDEQRQKREQAEKIQASIPGLYGDDGSFDYRAGAAMGIKPTDLKAYAEAPNAGRAKVARTMNVPGIDGQMTTIQLDDYGNKVGDGIGAYVAPQLVDTGDQKQFVTPRAGASYDVGMSPTQVDASRRGWANVDIGGEQNQIMREQNVIMGGLKNQEQEMKIEGMRADQAQRDRDLKAQQASAAAQVAVIDKALDHPGRTTVTGLSGRLDPRNFIAGTDATNFKTVVDQIGGAAFLQAFESLKGGGQITEIEGKKATDAMARLNTAQSDDEFKASLEELREIMVKGQQRLGGATQPLSAPTQQRSVVRTGRDGSGRTVIQYSDGSMEYGN